MNDQLNFIRFWGPGATVLLPASYLVVTPKKGKACKPNLKSIARAAEDQAFDRRRIAALERGKIQPVQKDRGKVLKVILVANGGKMLAKDAWQLMRLPKNVISELLKTQAGSIKATAAAPRMPRLLAAGCAAAV